MCLCVSLSAVARLLVTEGAAQNAARSGGGERVPSECDAITGFGPFEIFGDELGQQAAVVDVGVGEDHGIQFLRIEGEGCTVAFFVLAPSLVHAAIEQNANAVMGFQQIA